MNYTTANRILRRLLLAGLLGVLAGCVGQAAFLPATPTPTPAVSSHPLFFSTIFEPETAVAGQPQSLHVRLNVSPLQLSMLSLAITYPGGGMEVVLESIHGADGTLTWTIPPDAGAGTAIYRLSSQGCGCGPDDRDPDSALNSALIGTFEVQP